VFLTVIRCRLKNRRIEVSVVVSPHSSSSRRTIWARVRSFSASFSASNQAECRSSGDRLRPPRGRCSMPPVPAFNVTQRTAEAGLTRNRAAA